MSLSEQARSNNLDLLVRHAMQELDDNEFDSLFIQAEDPPFDEIVPTTWEEAKRRSYVKNQAWQTYQFAEHGWLRGVEILRLTEDPVFAGKLSKLSATLRGYVTPRPQQEQLVDIFGVAERSGLQRSFIYNVIGTRLLDRTYSFVNGPHFDPNDRNRHIIVVPIEYGLRPLRT